MNDLLTVRQVQEILKVDRITVYRMVQDGRLNGLKIGTQWRFPSTEIQNLLSGNRQPETPVDNSSVPTFPTHCIQLVQDAVSDLSDIGSLIVDFQGNPITSISKQNRFCSLIQSSESGMEACLNCWKDASLAAAEGETDHVCHAGLTYRLSPIHENGRAVAFLLAGQYCPENEVENIKEAKIQNMAEHFQLDSESLAQAVGSVPVYDQNHVKALQAWPTKITRVLEGILQERTILLERLRRIAQISAV